jgi:hypothetical protein
MRADGRLKTLIIAASAIGMIILGYYTISPLRVKFPSRNSQYNKTFGQAVGTRPPYCVPIPRNIDLPYPPSPTPNLLTQQSPDAWAAWTPGPTVTPIPFAKTVDLDPNSPEDEKSEVVVFRCDGSFERWLLGPDNLIEEIQLIAGDVILGSAPPGSLMGHEPPTLASNSESTPTPTTSTPGPYPLP